MAVAMGTVVIAATGAAMAGATAEIMAVMAAVTVRAAIMAVAMGIVVITADIAVVIEAIMAVMAVGVIDSRAS